MLREILYRLQQEKQLQELPRPCDFFDLAGGTSTGGYGDFLFYPPTRDRSRLPALS